MVRDWHAQTKARLQTELEAKDAARMAQERKAAKGARKDRRPRQLTQASVRDGSATAARAYRLLHAVFATAEEDDLVAANPCRIKGVASHKPAERPVLSIPEVLALAAEVPPRYEALVHLLVWSGVRIGEASALQRRDLDLTPGRASVSVRERVYPLKGVHDIDTPKSRAGVRTIAIPGMLAEQLEQHLSTVHRQGLVQSGVHHRERRQHPHDLLPNAATRSEPHRSAGHTPARPSAHRA